MRRIIKNIMIIYACILMVSCGENSIDKTLDCVENIIVSYPDSALMLLDSIKNPYTLTNFQHARHTILALCAKDLTGKDVSKDTLIVYVKDFLKTAGNPKYLAFAEYYLGRMYQAQGRNEQALQFYLDAKTNAESSDDDDIKGLIYSYIGQLHYDKSKLNHAIDYFKLSLECFHRCQDYKRTIPVFIMLGNTFLMKKNTDSAFICYNNAMQLAESRQDSVQMAFVKQNSGTVYWNINKPDTAIKQLYQALELNPKLSDMIYLNLSYAYKQKNMIDSAKYFADLSLNLLKEKNETFAFSLSTNYKLLARLEEQTGNYSEALCYLHEYNKCIKQINTQKELFNIDEIEKKHNLKLLNESEDKLQLAVIVILILIFSTISTVAFIVYSRIKNRKRLNRLFVENEKIRKSLSESENELNSALDEKEKLTCDILQIYKDACILIYDMKVAGNAQMDISKKIFPQGKWRSINRLFNTLFANIRKHFSNDNDLKEQYIQIICLTCIGFSIIEISVVLDMNKNTAQQIITEIRKKLGISNRGKIKDFVLNIINNTP